MSVRGFESLSLRRVEAWQSGDCSGLEHRRPLGARRFESYSLRLWKVGRKGYCTVLLRRRPFGVCEFEPRTFRPTPGAIPGRDINYRWTTGVAVRIRLL